MTNRGPTGATVRDLGPAPELPGETLLVEKSGGSLGKPRHYVLSRISVTDDPVIVAIDVAYSAIAV